MPQQPYKPPPITEAIVQIRFAAPIDAAAVAKVGVGFADFYPHEQTVRNVNVALGVPPRRDDAPTAQVINQETGYRRSSLDLTEIIILWQQSFVISQLAPYPGWDGFFRRFVRDWTIWKKSAGYRKVGRVGVRYINRIDIPLAGRPVIEETEFLNVYPHIPKELGPTNAYGVQAVLPILDINCRLTLNSSVVPSPLLNHVSFIIDQDIAKEVDTPQSDENLYELLNAIRLKKNEIFEACITDRARELFQR